MNTKQILGLIGSIVLFVGAFSPIISIPIIGNMNYFQNGKGDGTLIIILAISTFVAVILKKYKIMWGTGIGSFTVMAFTFVNF